MTDRRDFLKTAGGLAAATLVTAAIPRAAHGLFVPPLSHSGPLPEMDAVVKDLLLEAINAAKIAGASFADARISRFQQNFVVTREQQIQNVVDTETFGCGVRCLVDGTWGFAATQKMTKQGVADAARNAVAIAKANRVARDRAITLVPTDAHPNASWKSDFTIDPWTISVEEKADLLLRANAEAMKAPNVKFVFSALFFVRDERNYASTDGSVINQLAIKSWPLLQATAVSADRSDFQNRGNMIAPMGRGWEYIIASDLPAKARQAGEEASQKLSAKPVDVGRYDLVLDPGNMWLTIHESIGHATELDRALGYEANYAGTSFLAPPEKMLGSFKYGPEIMNIRADRSQAGALSTIGFDDDGVRPEDFMLVRQGQLRDYQTTREQAGMLQWWYDRNNMPTKSHGCCYAQGWNNVQFQRMPNVSLMPGEQNHGWNDLIAATDRGIAIVGDGSFSIDQQRFNGQFGGQVFYEIKGGKIVGMLKDVAYQIRTPDFWNSLDMLGGQASYELGGSFFDGKGQPSQSNSVSHGSPPARFRNVNVINTGRKA
ncbi:MAG TPA: TldD/PmbA family protein [Gemmatimonadaceae bacterium]|nr:TldD/PmbA family protein [Gemmatimonadaceae bacterium]